MALIRPMVEGDLAEAERIVRRAFGTFLDVPNLDAFWTDRHYVHGRYGAEHVAAFTAVEEDAGSGAVVGSNFAVRWGSVGFFGPLTIRPDLWNAGVGQDLVAAACAAFDGWGLGHTGLFTFPHSTKHVYLYGKFGFHPRFLTAVMTLSTTLGGGAGPGAARYSALAPGERPAAERACREVGEALYEGLDLAGEIRTGAARGLGDTLLLEGAGGRLEGFAVCEWGPQSSAGEGSCLVKFLAVRPGARAAEKFGALVDAARHLAASVGMGELCAAVNLSHEEAYRALLARGFRTAFQGVTMHRPNVAGYSRGGLYVLDDWR